MIDQSLFLITVYPETICRQGFPIHDKSTLDAMSSVSYKETFCNFSDNTDVQSCNAELHQTAFLHVVTETVFDYPHNSYGEKTWKPIVNLRPFVLVSVPNALQELKDMGFKTFDNWWDESYDRVVDPLQRINSIVKIIDWIASKSIDQLKMLYDEMKPTLIHNYDHYYGEFRSNALAEFELQCQKNILPR
jgi:hypothetical protein